ncbi:hypothetical protein [Chitinophaga flava]|nr:hypothetical protein [Chitinophaga flava]
MRYRKLLFLAAFITLLYACRKGELPMENYFGRVALTQVVLGDTTNLDIFYNGKKVGAMIKAPEAIPTVDVVLPAGQQAAKLSIYKAGTDSLVADTSIIITQNSAQSFRVISSRLLNINGFIGSAAVTPDSSKFQLFYYLNQSFNDYPEAEMYIYTSVGRPAVLTEVLVVKGLKKGVLDPRVFTLPCKSAAGATLNYVFKLKDSKTGNWILRQANTVNGSYIFMNMSYESFKGRFNLVSIIDVDGDTPETNKVKMVPNTI